MAMAKSSVAPLKQINTPRPELTAALVNAKVGTSLRRELVYDQINEIYWTNSRVVLEYSVFMPLSLTESSRSVT